MFWVGNQGEGTSPCCTLFFSDFRTSFSFSLWLGGWDHFTRRTETFQKISNMYGYLFVHITLHGFFSEFSVVRGKWWDRQYRVWIPQCAAPLDVTVTYARDSFVDSPSVLRPGWHMQETALWIPRGAFCPLEGGPRHIGTDTLAPVLHCIHVVLKTFLYVSHH